jgi:hypothetical protein
MGIWTMYVSRNVFYGAVIPETIYVSLMNHKFPKKEKIGNLVPKCEMFHILVTPYLSEKLAYELQVLCE